LPRCKVDVELAAALGLCVRTRKVNLNVLAVARPNHAFGTLKKRTEVFEERRVADRRARPQMRPELPQRGRQSDSGRKRPRVKRSSLMSVSTRACAPRSLAVLLTSGRELECLRKGADPIKAVTAVGFEAWTSRHPHQLSNPRFWRSERRSLSARIDPS
jgi:hypothetical protein